MYSILLEAERISQWLRATRQVGRHALVHPQKPHSHLNVMGEQHLKIGLIAPPIIAVPPADYGGTELFVANLAEGLHRVNVQVVVHAMVNRQWPRNACYTDVRRFSGRGGERKYVQLGFPSFPSLIDR